MSPQDAGFMVEAWPKLRQDLAAFTKHLPELCWETDETFTLIGHLDPMHLNKTVSLQADRQREPAQRIYYQKKEGRPVRISFFLCR